MMNQLEKEISALPKKPKKIYEILEDIEKMEREGLIPKPSYRLVFYPLYRHLNF